MARPVWAEVGGSAAPRLRDYERGYGVPGESRAARRARPDGGACLELRRAGILPAGGEVVDGESGVDGGSDSSVLREVVPADCAVVEARRPPYGRRARPNRIPRGCRSTQTPGPASRCPVGPTERIRRRPAVGGQRLAAGSDHLRKRPRISSQVSATAPAQCTGDQSMIVVSFRFNTPAATALTNVASNSLPSARAAVRRSPWQRPMLRPICCRVTHGSARHAAFEYRLLTTPPSFRGPLLFGETSTPLDLDRTRRRTLNPANHAQAPDIGSLPIAGTNPPSHRAEEILR